MGKRRRFSMKTKHLLAACCAATWLSGCLNEPEAPALAPARPQPVSAQFAAPGAIISSPHATGNAKSDPSLFQDRLVSFGPSTLPSSVDFSDKIPPPGNQGQEGSCTSWAVAYAAMSGMEAMEEGW